MEAGADGLATARRLPRFFFCSSRIVVVTEDAY